MMYEDLIEKLRNNSSGFVSGDTVREAADAIEDLSNAGSIYGKAWTLGYDAGRDENKPRWIPVTEKLPEKEDEAVIVWEKQGFALIDWRHDNKWAILDNNCGIATYWMPLPEPPKDGA